MDTRQKILERADLVNRLSQHRKTGQRIVMANGCFDLLHVGHLRYLEGARQRGDVLVVAVNSDEGIRLLKGAGRPILPAEARARLVAAVGVVDYVTIFEEPDVRALLSTLRPDIHAKGTDYTLDTVPERDTARSLGIEIAIVGDAKSHATRDLLDRLRQLPNARDVTPHSFLIVRLGSLGDLVHTVPAVAAIRKTFPNARMDWIVERKWVPLVKLVQGIDEVIARDRTVSSQFDCVRHMRHKNYACAVDFQGLYKSAIAAWLSGAPRRIGFDAKTAREPGSAWFYTETVSPVKSHVAGMNLRLAARAGACVSGEMYFPLCVPGQASLALSQKLLAEGIEKYMVVSPGGGWNSKCWPPDRYGKLCLEIWNRYSLRAVVNIGPGEDNLASELLRAALPQRPFVVRPDLPELAALMSHAKLVAAADTGPLHLAAALGARVVGLFGPTDPARNGPLPKGTVVRNARAEATTYKRGSVYSPSMLSITVDQVLAAVEREISVTA